ncbi:MAG: ATP-binding cassette domain-containing protein [Hyphomicrobiales bacterium]|nr:ATP-binding cassette domain-containing protein [Hyphomicrobiales bacterium]
MQSEENKDPQVTQADSEPLALDIQHLTQTFFIGKTWLNEGKALRAVDDISLQVRNGEVLAIVGESGCGKTTLSRMMLGLQKPKSGVIYVNGEALVDVDRKSFARRVQPVFQDPYSSLNPRRTIGEIIMDPLLIHDIGTPEERQQRVEETMAKVGLPHRMIHSYPSQMSGGQRQRVAIARALVMKPEVLICDEPTSALDVSVQAQILNLLQELRNELNLTYIFISHDLSVVEYMADFVAVMYLGRFVEVGPARDVLEHPKHPYTRALLGSVLTPDPELDLPDIDLGRGFPDPLNPPPGCRFHPRCPKAMAVCSQQAPEKKSIEGTEVECHLYTTETVGETASAPA